MNGPSIRNKSSLFIKKFPKKKSSGLDNFASKFHKLIQVQEGFSQVLQKYFHKIEDGKLPTYSMSILLPWLKKKKKKKRKKEKKQTRVSQENYRPISLMDIGSKGLNKIPANWI